MAKQATVGQILINSILPEHIRDYNRKLDKAGIAEVMEGVARENDPDLYRDVVKALHDVGAYVAQSTGSSFSIRDLQTPPKTRAMMDALRAKVTQTVERDDLTSEQKDAAVQNMVLKAAPKVDSMLKTELIETGNPFGTQVISGSRGNMGDVRSLMAGDLMVTDHKDRLVPVPMLSGYASGVGPAEYWAGSYGARKGGISTKLCLSEHTMVRMADGSVKRIKDIRPGDYVMRPDSTNRMVSVMVTNVFNNGLRECYEHVFKANQSSTPISITATPDHKVRATRQFSSREGYRAETGMWPLKHAVRRHGGRNKTFSLRLVEGSSIYGRSEPGALLLVNRKPMGELPTYDLEVAHDSHCFVLANGMVVSNSTARTGFLGKQLVQVANRAVVSTDDCGTQRGIPVGANDPDNVGTILAEDTAGIPAGTIIGTKTMRELNKKLGDGDEIMVRSPLTCKAKRGVCAKCTGVRERGTLPEIGDPVGVSSAHAITERVTQAALSLKHGGGRATGEEQSQTPRGYDLINQLVQVPKSFQGGAAVASLDGTINSVDKAPQGGYNIMIGDENHHVPAGLKVDVKPGDRVEAGDVMSEGIPNPADLVRHRGVGDGRMAFTQIFRKALKDSGTSTNRRNIEMLARGLVNHVRVNELDGVDDALPDDVVEYNMLERNYRPRYGARSQQPKASVGKYLEVPVRHYSIGTRINKRVAADLNKHGVKEIRIHDDPPPFEPEMTRAMAQMSVTPDWQARLGGSYLQRGLLEAVHRGRSSEISSESYVPGMARGKGFGDELKTKGIY